MLAKAVPGLVEVALNEHEGSALHPSILGRQAFGGTDNPFEREERPSLASWLVTWFARRFLETRRLGLRYASPDAGSAREDVSATSWGWPVNVGKRSWPAPQMEAPNTSKRASN